MAGEHIHRMKIDPESVVLGQRLTVAFDLHRFGVDMMRMNLKRRDPAADDALINARLAHWFGHDGFDPQRTLGMTPRPWDR